jgi:hypothetical protein
MQFYEPISLTAASYTLTKSHAGTTIMLNRAGGITIVLPPVDAGLVFRFIVGTAPTTAYTIAPAASANIMIGSVNEAETDTTEDGPSATAGDLFSFVANLALPGDWVTFTCDGTSWMFTGQTVADGAVTIGST